VLAGSPADFESFVARETAMWGKVIRAANIEPDSRAAPNAAAVAENRGPRQAARSSSD